MTYVLRSPSYKAPLNEIEQEPLTENAQSALALDETNNGKVF